MLQQKDSIDSGETLRNKKTFFYLLSFIAQLHSLRCHPHKFPIRAILNLLRSSFNEGFSYLKLAFCSYAKNNLYYSYFTASIIPVFMPLYKCHIPSLLQLKCFVFVEAFSLSVISLLLNVFQSPEHSCTVFLLSNFSFIILCWEIPYLACFNQSFLIFCHP